MKTGPTPTAKGRGRRRSLRWANAVTARRHQGPPDRPTPTACDTPTAALGLNLAYADGLSTPTAALGLKRPTPTALGRRRPVTRADESCLYADGPDIWPST